MFFEDIRDKTQRTEKQNRKPLKTIKNEIHTIILELKKEYVRKSLSAFLLWEISLYGILLLYVDFDVITFSSSAVTISCGYLLGVILLKFFPKISDSTMIKIGYNVSGLSLVPFFLVYPFTDQVHHLLIAFCYFFHALGNALLCATIFALLSKETSIHSQGRLYGLIAATDTIAFLIASISIIIYTFFKLDLIYIVLFSYITVTASWIPYAKFEKVRPSVLEK